MRTRSNEEQDGSKLNIPDELNSEFSKQKLLEIIRKRKESVFLNNF